MSDTNHAAVAVAIADIFDHDVRFADQIEGLLLVAGGNDETLTPVKVARETGLGREAVANLFRQLDTKGAVSRTSHSGHIAESHFTVRTTSVRRIFALTRQAIRIIEASKARQPPVTEIEPLVTFPDDPAFDDVTPATFGMNQLLSALATEVKNATEAIVLVAPFFEGTGFDRLRGVLADALERGVELIIITRYLTDETSHNRAVIEEFIEYLDAERGVADQVRTVDYTVWDESVPASDRRQDGSKPAFTLHAKVMLFDETTAYVGSANVTDYGFDRYLELGVLLRGPDASRYRDLCDFLLESDAATDVAL